MTKIFRKLAIESVEWVKNSLKTRELPKTVYKGLFFRLTMNHDNGAAPTLASGTLAELIQKISITINGQDVMISVPFFHLFFHSWYSYGTLPIGSIDNTAAVAGRTSYMTCYLPFALLRAVLPADSLLDMRNVSSVNLEVEWGDALTKWGDVVVNSASLDIVSHEYSNVDVSGGFARHELSFIETNLDTIGIIPVKLETGENNQYRRLWIYTWDSANHLSTPDLIEKVGLKSRFFYFINQPADMLRFANSMEFSLSEDALGLYVIDLPSDGRMAERLDARKLSELILELTSTVVNGKVTVVKEKVVYA